jgi:hypothetical protein
VLTRAVVVWVILLVLTCCSLHRLVKTQRHRSRAMWRDYILFMPAYDSVVGRQVMRQISRRDKVRCLNTAQGSLQNDDHMLDYGLGSKSSSSISPSSLRRRDL